MTENDDSQTNSTFISIDTRRVNYASVYSSKRHIIVISIQIFKSHTITAAVSVSRRNLVYDKFLLRDPPTTRCNSRTHSDGIPREHTGQVQGNVYVYPLLILVTVWSVQTGT